MLNVSYRILTILLATTVVGIFSRSVKKSTFDTLCYVPLDQLFGNPPKIVLNTHLCTHMILGDIKLDDDTLTMTFDGSSYGQSSEDDFCKQINDLKNGSVKVLIRVVNTKATDMDSQFSRLVGSDLDRGRFVDHSIEFLQKHCFDGLDLEWNDPEIKKSDYGQLARELSQAFKLKGLLVSATVLADALNIDEGYDVPTLSEHMDWLTISTNDYHLAQWDVCVHSAPLQYEEDSFSEQNAVDSMAKWIENGADPAKLVMQIPAYGIRYKLKNENDHDLHSAIENFGRASLEEMCRANNSKEWTSVRHPTLGTYSYNGDTWISFNDVGTVRSKAHYIVEKNFFGALLTNVEFDDPGNECGHGKYPLLTAMHEILAPARSLAQARSLAPAQNVSSSIPNNEVSPTSGGSNHTNCGCLQHDNGHDFGWNCTCNCCGFIEIEYELNQTIKVIPKSGNNGTGIGIMLPGTGIGVPMNRDVLDKARRA